MWHEHCVLRHAPATSFVLNEEKRLKCNRDLLRKITLSLGPAEELCVVTVQHETKEEGGSAVFSHDMNYREAVCRRGISTTSGEAEVDRAVRPVVSRR
jgi:hypothetical protein